MVNQSGSPHVPSVEKLLLRCDYVYVIARRLRG